MNLEEVKALSDDELRVKVAELCGWKRYECESGDGSCGWIPPKASQEARYLKRLQDTPDYCNDVKSIVNAISDHMATHPMDRFIDELNRFISILEKLCPDMEDLWNAQARPRAEAFVVYMETR